MGVRNFAIFPGVFSAVCMVGIAGFVVLTVATGADWVSYWKGVALGLGMAIGAFALIGGFAWLSMVWK